MKVAVDHHSKNAFVFKIKLQDITKMSSWNIHKKDDKIQPNPMFFNFFQNAIFNLSKSYPSFIVNDKREHARQKSLRGLSKKHLDDLDKLNQKNLSIRLVEYNDDDKYKTSFRETLLNLKPSFSCLKIFQIRMNMTRTLLICS